VRRASRSRSTSLSGVLCLTDDPAAGVPLGATADGLLNRASDTTRLVDRVVQARLVERMPNASDRRGVLVRATPAGARCSSGSHRACRSTTSTSDATEAQTARNHAVQYLSIRYTERLAAVGAVTPVGARGGSPDALAEFHHRAYPGKRGWP
jgi:DNA-binding MarR family transcriptional regulator